MSQVMMGHQWDEEAATSYPASLTSVDAQFIC